VTREKNKVVIIVLLTDGDKLVEGLTFCNKL